MKRTIFMAAAVAACVAGAEVRFAYPFNDGMVLQREKPVAVWGTAATSKMPVVPVVGRGLWMRRRIDTNLN